MKMLLVGMDGVQESSFRRGWTPYIESLLDDGNRLHLEEDLISRGWAKIMTGQHGLATGALYERPLADGTHGWTEKCRLSDIAGFGTKIKPLWQVLNEQGVRVGIMNVPTTFPAPQVDGFFVSGGGGGGPVVQDVTPEQCYPKQITNPLAEMGYIVDERLTSLLSEKKMYDPESLFSRLMVMNEKRTESFISLSNEFNVDFGFVVYKSSVVTAETFLLPQIDRCDQLNLNWKGAFFESVTKFYEHFDKQLEKLASQFPEAQIVLVSDHGMVSKKFAVNSNGFLIDAGFQIKSSSNRQKYDFIKRIKNYIPFFLRNKLKQNKKIRLAYESMITFDPIRSKAFSMSFSNGRHGIYVNDVNRFGGPVAEEDKKKLIADITAAFNNYPQSVEHGFSAIPKEGFSEEYSEIFPDILLQLPNNYMTTNKYDEFIKEEPLVKELTSFSSLGDLPNACIKSPNPLAVCSGEWQCTGNQKDLTAIYNHISSFFNATKK